MKKTIEVKKTAHYYLQYPKHTIQSILIIIHGYAQLAEDFIKDFDALEDSNTLIIAPEALSKFYNKERKPVANWMTSHNRIDEINDYVSYLNQLLSVIRVEYPNTPIDVLGFSQGVSTLLRWITRNDLSPRTVHLCSGSIPPELTSRDFSLLEQSYFYYYYGSADRLLKEENAIQQFQLLDSLAQNVRLIKFEGRHEISKECLKGLMNLS